MAAFWFSGFSFFNSVLKTGKAFLSPILPATSNRELRASISSTEGNTANTTLAWLEGSWIFCDTSTRVLSASSRTPSSFSSITNWISSSINSGEETIAKDFKDSRRTDLSGSAAVLNNVSVALTIFRWPRLRISSALTLGSALGMRAIIFWFTVSPPSKSRLPRAAPRSLPDVSVATFNNNEMSDSSPTLASVWIAATRTASS